MVFGLKVLEIPTFVGKKFSIFIALSTMCIIKSFGIHWNSKLWQAAWLHSFTTQICHSISGMCSLGLARLTSGPPGRDSIRILRGANFPAACMVVMRKPQWSIREEKLLQLLLWKMVHFALFLVKISINFSPSYSTVFFPITVDVSTLQKFQNFSTMF